MTSLLQQYAHKGQLKALSEAIKVIKEVQPVFDEHGIDVTADARESLLNELRSEYAKLLGIKPDSAQKAPGLAGIIMFYIQVRNAKKKYKDSAKDFKSESKIIRERILEDIEGKAARKVSEEVISKMLRDERLSMDTKQVAKDIEMRKASLEVTGLGAQSQLAQSQHISRDLQRHILSPSEIDALFEQAQNHQGIIATLNDTEMVAQQGARAASPQGLSVPPWMVHAGSHQRVAVQDTVALTRDNHPHAGTSNQQVAVQDPVALTRGKHQRTNTFGNVLPLTGSTSAISIGGSSGYDASSSCGSVHSYKSIFNEDNFAGIDTRAVYNDLRRLFREASLKNL